MTIRHPRTALTLLSLAVLAACGGADGPDSQAQSGAQRMRALAATGGSSGVAAANAPITAQQLFTWAQMTYPELFGTAAPQTISGLAFDGKIFEVRAYSTGNYLGVTNTGEAYGYGPFVGNQLFRFGAMQQYADLVCAKVDCSGNGGGGGTGTVNECFDPAIVSPPTGMRMKLLYALTGPVESDMTMEMVVDGPRTFEGQSATQITTTLTQSMTSTFQGGTSTSTSTSVSKGYQQPNGTGLFRELGSLDEYTSTTSFSAGGMSLPPTTTTQSSKTIYNPPDVPTEYTLALGQQVTRTSSWSTTILASSTGIPAPGTVTNDSETMTSRFVAKESVTVPAGTYSACRYTMTSGSGSEASTVTTWYLLGKGVPVKTEVATPAGTQLMQLKPGSTYNGAPL